MAIGTGLSAISAQGEAPGTPLAAWTKSQMRHHASL